MSAATALRSPSAQQTRVGGYFGLPGITRPFSMIENNDGISTTLNQSNQVSVTGMVPFFQTDVLEYYEMRSTITQTVTNGSATVAVSPYFPYNYFGPGNLRLQNQFPTLLWNSGIDLAIWQQMRPMFPSEFRDELYQIPRGNAYSLPANLVTATNYTSASTTLKFTLELPVSLWFNRYFPLDVRGNILGPAQRAWVSPQFMAGTQRIVQPILNYNPIATTGASANNDLSPVIATGTLTGFSATGSNVLNFRRVGYYQPTDPQGRDSPPVYNWQYTRQALQVTVSGRSSVDIPITQPGQLLSIVLRGFDPATGTGGQVIPLANITNCFLQYGPGLFRFQDHPVDMQARYIQQHGSFPFADGVLAWDLAQDKDGQITNQYALNTYNTSGVKVHLDFIGAQTSAAYYVVLTEALQWVTQG